MRRLLIILLAYAMTSGAMAAGPRARDLGVPFDGSPGVLDAITDVAGVEVGQVTLIEDLADGHKVRTGVTAVVPRGRASDDVPVFSGWFALNGNGEMTGTTWLQESGQLEGPIMLTNTHSVGVVRDAVIAERVRRGGADASGYWWSLPVVAETWDGDLNDINGFHVHAEDAVHALHAAGGGPVDEGSVGGGTGMTCHEFKCGIGTASRLVHVGADVYMLGVLVQANYGTRDSLQVAGVPVGRYLRDGLTQRRAADTGSIIVVVATDAPLLPHQLTRVARRAGMGLARMGSYSGNGSGDIFIAFSTANPDALHDRSLQQASFIGNDHLDPLFEATVQAVEESIVNAMVAARDMCGEQDRCVKAIPHAELVALLKRFGRYHPPR